MIPLTWEFDKGDVARLRARMDKLRTELDGPHIRDFLRREVHPYIRGRVVERFRVQGDDAVAGPWEELKDATKRWRRFYIERGDFPRTIGEDRPINVRSGRLRSWVSRSFDIQPSGAKGIELIQPSKRETVGGLFVKLKRAQLGDARTAARPVIKMNRTDQRDIEKLTFDWMERAMRARS